MKPVKFLFLFIGILSFSASMAQPKKETPEETMQRLTREIADELLKDVKEDVKQGLNVITADDTKKIIEHFNSNAELRAKREKLYGTNHSKPIVFQRQANESERIGWVKGIPVPLYPEQALNADPRQNEKYGDRVEKYLEGLKLDAQRLANTTKLAQTYEKGGQKAVEEMYRKDIDQNPMIAQMGGSKKLENMSEKERKEAANKMVSDMTGGLTPEQIQKMTPAQKQALAKQMAAKKMASQGTEVGAAFTQELMANESYRKRYEAMSTAEKQEEYKKYEERYNAGSTSQPAAYKPQPVNEASQQDAREIQLITKFSEDFYKQIQDEIAPVSNLAKRYQEHTNALTEALGKWAAAAVSALPIVRDSEYGPRRDGIEFVIFTEKCMSYMIGKDRIAKEREIWEKQVNVHVNAFKKLDDFYATYAGRKNLSDRMKLALAELIVAGYESILDLNKQADFITGTAGGIQYSYNCEVLRNCKDPRQDKY